MGYLDKVNADIGRWQKAGLVTSDTAEALRHDLEANHGRGLGFGQVLAIMAGLLLAAAILLMVAANWEAIPRLWRVGTLFVLLALSYVGGAVLKNRGQDQFAEAAWLVGAATFGGAIALISQMYHISGDETQAILVWALGVALSAAALRSPVLTVIAVALAGVWVSWPAMSSFRVSLNLWYPLLLALLWACSIWTRSVPARHLILLSLVGYCVFLYGEFDQIGILVVLALVSAAVFLAATLLPDVTERLTGLGEGLAVDGLIGAYTGLFALQFVFADTAHFMWIAILGLGAIIGALLVGGRLGRGVRWLSYAAFAVEIATIYGVTIGSMLGTAGFFLVAAIGLAILAFIIIRIERRMASLRGTGA
ncbi:MAG: DUF2157 domain-containing protein [Mesorhizobium sp.]